MQELLGLPLETALFRLRAQGIEPRVTFTRAPKGQREDGEPRVVRISADGSELTAARFLNPLAQGLEESNR